MKLVNVGSVEVEFHREDGIVAANFNGQNILDAIIELGLYDDFERKAEKALADYEASNQEADYMAWAS